MAKNSVPQSARPQALVFAAAGTSTLEVAAFKTSDGEILVSNADINPYSPVDGKQMQVISKQRTVLASAKLAKMVKVGHCATCDNTLLATAALADQLETEGKPFNCVLCSSEVQPEVDERKLITALAEEHSGDMDEGDPEDVGDDAGVDDDSESDIDDDFADDGGDESTEDEDDEPFDGGDMDDEDYTDEPEENPEDDGETYEDDDAVPQDGAVDEDADPVPDSDEDRTDEQAAEIATAVKALRAKMAELGMGDDCDDEDMDDDSDKEDSADKDDEENEYEDEEAAIAAFREQFAAKKAVAHTKGDRPVAGKSVDNADIAMMNQAGRATIKERHAGKVDGNATLKSASALASNMEGDSMSGEDGKTPGTNATEGEREKQLKTPGSTDKAAPNPDTQPETPGTEMTSAEKIVDWRNAKVQLIATNDETRWVFANNVPVAQLVKSEASEGVSAVWADAILEKSFAAVAKRGLPAEEAKEFGFKPHMFEVKADDALRNVFRRQRDEATASAERNITKSTEAYRQSLKTAAIAILKGTFGDKNPMREALVAKLTSLAVAEPHSVVDTALAASVEPFIVDVFKKAEEIAAKNDDARNEVASLVTSSTYQARVTDADAAALANKLAQGSMKVIAGSMLGASKTATTEKSGTSDRSDRFAATLRSISRQR